MGLLLALAYALPSAAQPASPPQPLPESAPDAAEPAPSRRTIHHFTFEEHDPASPDFNPDPIPRYWFRAQDDPAAGRPRPGFPPWNAAAFDLSAAASGRTSLRLPVSGGSASLRLMPGAVPVFPGADYVVSAAVRTDGADRSRAFLVARFLDASRRPIDASEVRSAPTLSPDRWTPLSIELRGDHPNAAFLQVDLELLQPRQFDTAAAAALRDHAVLLDDVHAAAWFDDVAIVQIPRTDLTTTSSLNITVAPDRPLLRFSVRDMVGDDLDARITIRDSSGARVAITELPINAGGRIMEWSPPLSGYGWFSATLEITHRQRPIASTRTQFLWLPPSGPRPVDDAGPESIRRFGLVADHTPPGLPAWPAFLPHTLRAVRSGFIVLPHADPTLTADGLSDALTLTRTPLDELIELGQEITLAIAAVPAPLAAQLRIDPRDTLTLAVKHPESAWRPFLLPLLDRYGQRITRWQIAPTAGAPSAAAHPAVGPAVLAFNAGLSRFVPGLVLSVPWRAGAALPESAAQMIAAPAADTAALRPLDAVTLVIPPGASGATLDEALAPWLSAATPPPEITVVLTSDPPAGLNHDRREALGDLVKRAFDAVAAGERFPPGAPPLRIAIDRPWTWTPGPRSVALPGPELAVWRTILDHLAGRVIVTELPVAPGVRCFLLTDPEPAGPSAGPDAEPLRGALLAWNESARPEDAVLRAYLGQNPLTLVDIFGNAAPVEPSAEAHGAHAIPIPASPVFIEGVDPRIVQFIAAFRVDPPFARSTLTSHEHAFVLENPWPIRITGQLQVVSPEQARGWTISPRGAVPFSIPPGGVERIPVSFSFSGSEEAGRKHFGVLVKLTADREYPAQLLTAPLDVGSEDLDLRCTLDRSPTPDGPDLVAVITVHNRGRHARTLRLEAFAPKLPTQQVTISDLAPGESAVRRIAFRGAAEALSGRRIRIALSDADAPERLNTSVIAP